MGLDAMLTVALVAAVLVYSLVMVGRALRFEPPQPEPPKPEFKKRVCCGTFLGMQLDEDGMRSTFLGIGPVDMGFGTTTEVHVRTKRPFQPTRLVMPSSLIGMILKGVRFNGQDIAVRLGFVALEKGVPLELFSGFSNLSTHLEWPIINPGDTLTLVIENLAAIDEERKATPAAPKAVGRSLGG
jgi:hypothetical protein